MLRKEFRRARAAALHDQSKGDGGLKRIRNVEGSGGGGCANASNTRGSVQFGEQCKDGSAKLRKVFNGGVPNIRRLNPMIHVGQLVAKAGGLPQSGNPPGQFRRSSVKVNQRFAGDEESALDRVLRHAVS